MDLEKIGFNEWFQSKFSSYSADEFKVARVFQVNKSNYLISDGQKEIIAEPSGKFMFVSDSTLSLPTVGDWVVVQYFDEDTHAIIHDILPRKSLLKRKYPGKNIDFQLLAANIDYALIIQGADKDYNINRLERYLVMVNESNITPVFLLNKCDLISEIRLAEITESIKQLNYNFEFIPFSNVTGFGYESVLEIFSPAKSYCMLGSSGVGKTTLLNKLLGEDILKVNAVREKDGKGKHTTTNRSIFSLTNGSLIIDTPGLRELANFDVETGFSETFEEILSIAKSCRFSDCTHSHENECAVLKAVDESIISKDRYKNFIKIQKETRFYEMSYLEKRRKDKEFGKMVKQIMKNKKKK